MNEVDGIDIEQFTRIGTVREIRESSDVPLPSMPGVYLVLRMSTVRPEMLPLSSAGWFKSQDPSYPIDVVKSNWVDDAHILYVGKTECKHGLRGRVRQLVAFAYGKRCGHRGGRMLWHLADWRDLEVYCLACRPGQADELEINLIGTFRGTLGTRPFANMVR